VKAKKGPYATDARLMQLFCSIHSWGNFWRFLQLWEYNSLSKGATV